jgi:tRNA U34 5-methylaminomethyl-2-thiouridine-forming methyltransferase MnmC
MQKDLFDQVKAQGAGERQTDLEDLIDEKVDPLTAVTNELYEIGAPVIEDYDGVYVSGEQNDKVIWADYCMMGEGECDVLDDFGVNHKINAVLEKHGFFAEWQNPGRLAVCEA